MHPLIRRVLLSDSTTMPMVLDEDSAVEAVTIFSWLHITSLDECLSGNIPWVSLYEKDIKEDKKHLSVKDIRRWLSDISEIPYEKKHIYLLRDFDEATPEAMNATLKILEEPPGYAIILLIVNNPESLLETIASRTLNGFTWKSRLKLPEELRLWIKKYSQGDSIELVKYLYKEKIDHNTALEILMELSYFADSDFLKKIEECIISLYNVNETPRNIMDRIILTPRERI